MLSKKQNAKLATMTANYRTGVRKTSNAPEHIIKAWTQRYRCAIEQELRKQCKR